MKHFAIFGGTFDPVHLGHIQMASTAREKAGLDRVILMPCWQSPFKGKAIATVEQRLTMLRLSITDQKALDWAEVSDYEITRPSASYSWQTAEHFQNEFQSVKWSWILGTDQWEQLEKWAEPEKLRSMLHFVVMTRHGQSISPKPGWNFTEIPFSHPASATKIREHFAEHCHWLSPPVAEYCREFSIY